MGTVHQFAAPLVALLVLLVPVHAHMELPVPLSIDSRTICRTCLLISTTISFVHFWLTVQTSPIITTRRILSHAQRLHTKLASSKSPPATYNPQRLTPGNGLQAEQTTAADRAKSQLRQWHDLQGNQIHHGQLSGPDQMELQHARQRPRGSQCPPCLDLVQQDRQP